MGRAGAATALAGAKAIEPTTFPQWQVQAGFVAALLVNTALLYTIHDHFWWPADDGYYAHIATRLLRGDVLYRDLEDFHLGLVHVVNVLSMALFGETLQALRYPLLLAAIVQSMITYRIVAERSPWLALAASLAVSATGLPQFQNPSANWYVLLVAFVAGYILHRSREREPRLYVSMGALVGVAFLFRHLTAAFLGMAVLIILLTPSNTHERPVSEDEIRSPFRIARGVLVFVGLLLLAYGIPRLDVLTGPLFIAGPVLLAILAFRAPLVNNRQALQVLVCSGLGFALVFAPLLAYLLANSALDDCVRVLFDMSKALLAMPFIDNPRYYHLVLAAFVEFMQSPSPTVLLCSGYWLTLLCLPLVMALGIARRDRSTTSTDSLTSLVTIAVFVGVAALHFQIPIYLSFVAPILVAGTTQLASGKSRRLQILAGLWMTALAITGFSRMSSLPVESRATADLVSGRSVAADEVRLEGRAQIIVDRKDAETYTALLEVIERASEPEDAILALPNNPEFHFLADRRSPLPFVNLGLSVMNRGNEAIARLEADPPRLVIDRRDDKYHNPDTAALLDWVRSRYRLVRSLGDFDLYADAAVPDVREPRSPGKAGAL
ncbi:MAG: glycosyltransferase family 39 protein [Geminicoccaceae bacterium]